jgi:hypothetical protein
VIHYRRRALFAAERLKSKAFLMFPVRELQTQGSQ